MRIDLILVPYDSGHRGVRMGKGPEHLVSRGAVEMLRDSGHDVFTTVLESRQRFPLEVKTSFELYGAVAREVAAATKIRSFPIVLSGNCGAAIGALAGTGAESLLWFDAHGDYMTPETSRSGFLDGMAIAVATGRCWRAIAAGIAGFRSIDAHRILHAGARDWDPGERERLASDGGEVASVAEVRDRSFEPKLQRSVRGDVVVHVDLDVLDPETAVANPYPAPGGLTVGEVNDVVAAASTRARFAAAVLASFDPAADPRDRGTTAALDILAATVRAAAASRS